MHGNKIREQARLGVNGSTHESEHPVGFAVFNQTSGLSRNSKFSRDLEFLNPAYQEVKKLHNTHIGTGNHKRPDASGQNSDQI